MSLNFMLLYITTVFVASIIPGPSMLLAFTHGMQFGAKRTIASALGNLTVTLLQAFISVVGLGSILIASETMFLLLKMAGAGYLIYMGISLFLSEKTTIKPYNDSKPHGEVLLRKMYLQAAFVTAGNPKAIVFFMAVFPQFINPDSAYVPQFFLLMSIGALIAFSCFMVYAICGQKVVFIFSKNTIGRYINRIIGTAIIGAAIGLAVGKK